MIWKRIIVSDCLFFSVNVEFCKPVIGIKVVLECGGAVRGHWSTKREERGWRGEKGDGEYHDPTPLQENKGVDRISELWCLQIE